MAEDSEAEDVYLYAYDLSKGAVAIAQEVPALLGFGSGAPILGINNHCVTVFTNDPKCRVIHIWYLRGFVRTLTIDSKFQII